MLTVSGEIKDTSEIAYRQLQSITEENNQSSLNHFVMIQAAFVRTLAEVNDTLQAKRHGWTVNCIPALHWSG